MKRTSGTFYRQPLRTPDSTWKPLPTVRRPFQRCAPTRRTPSPWTWSCPGNRAPSSSVKSARTRTFKDNLGRQDFEDLISGKEIRKPESYLEKPVKADAYVNTIQKALQSPSVKTLVSHSVSASDPEKVKDELKGLIDGADPEKLAEALKILKKKK
jgi:hypothetical protein